MRSVIVEKAAFSAAMSFQLGYLRAEEREAERGVGLRGLQIAVEQRLERRPGDTPASSAARARVVIASNRRPMIAARSACLSAKCR